MAESGSSAPRSVASRPDNAASTSGAGHSFAHHRPLGYSARFGISEERLTMKKSMFLMAEFHGYTC